jgi:hypothetical protein
MFVMASDTETDNSGKTPSAGPLNKRATDFPDAMADVDIGLLKAFLRIFDRNEITKTPLHKLVGPLYTPATNSNSLVQ